MDKSNNAATNKEPTKKVQRPRLLKDFMEKMPPPPECTESDRSTKRKPKNKDFVKGFGILIALSFFAVVFWNHWKTITYTISFFGTWAGAAYWGLKSQKSKILSLGGGLITGTLVFIALHALLEKIPTAQFESEQIADTINIIPVEDKWHNLDIDTRKSNVEWKYKEARSLEQEMTDFLESANHGGLTVELIGKIQVWKQSVRLSLSEFEGAGYKSGESFNPSAMERVYSALTSMQFAWNNFEKCFESDSQNERLDYASKHTTHLKLMREGLVDAKSLMDRGEY